MSLNIDVDLQLIPNSLQTACSLWLSEDKNPETCSEIIDLIHKEDWNELHKRFDTRIAFGTAGLRSRMEAGFSRMNSLVVIQATQGLAKYIKHQFPDRLRAVVGHDHRYHSKEFAAATAATFLEAGFKVFYLNNPNEFIHTPLVPFAVDQVGATVGVMITASHNPKMDNGYKVYYANGCQIIPPHDRGIAESINENLKLWPNAWNSSHIIEKSLAQGSFIYAQEQMTAKYIDRVRDSLLNGRNPCSLKKGKPWFVYTPMHGVGYSIFNDIAFKVLNLNLGEDFLKVDQQSLPDPEFPTVSFPNPEEKGALDLAISLADKNEICLVLANDPDADRFSAAVKDEVTGKWTQISGNQLGFLFSYYELQKYKGQDSDFQKSHPLAMLNSTVSSQMIKKMAATENFRYEDTLTGFKWIGNRAIELVNDGWYVPFSFEEAIGYMFPQMEFDKDGISAAVIFLQAYNEWLVKSHKSPLRILEEAYKKYGFFKEHNGYFVVSSPDVLGDLFEKMRHYHNTSDRPYPIEIGKEFKVSTFRDLTVGYQSDTKDHKPRLPVDASSQMLTITATPTSSQEEEHVRFTVRGSGTEPKLKVYIESYAQNEGRAQYLAELLSNVLQREWLIPGIGGLSEKFHRT